VLGLLLALSVAACAADDGTDGTGGDDGERPPTTVDAGPAPTVDVPAGERAEVVRIVDGDTLEVELDGQEERVRLLGVNTPEHDECWFEQAVDTMVALVDGRTVTLVGRDRDRDQFDRLLRHVFVDDVFVDAEQARLGSAVATSEQGALQRQVLEAEDEARAAERGLWAPDACGEAAAGSGSVEVTQVVADPPGDDEQDPNGEVATIENGGDDTVDLSGWTLQDESSRHRYPFPDGTTIEPGDTVRVHSGCGPDGHGDLHWCADGPVWSNGGDTAFLKDPSGNTVSTLGV
jgi:endonuclease YncB( thermonuclease family)